MVKLNKILLGSGSPRRQLLLKELGIDFRVLISKTEEIPLPHLTGSEIAEYLAEEKAEVLIKQIEVNELLVTADTIVWLENELLGKPSDTKDAFKMLKKLSGNKHQVFTGICIADKKSKKIFSVESVVLFRKLSDEDIYNYIELYKPFDKAGAYGAQESLPENVNPCSEVEQLFIKENSLGNFFERTLSKEHHKRIPLIERIDGSYFNVMGLPIVELVHELKKF